MFWRMAGLSTTSPVESILDKDRYALEELLDEDDVIQECKALNNRLINFLRERPQVERLLRYIVEEAPEDAEKNRSFKFPFIACEIFTCDVDIILKTLVEDEELMNLLFSVLKPEHCHSNLLAGYFSKVALCLMSRKTVPFMNYIQAHQEIFQELVDLIGITSVMEVLIRIIGADDHMYSNYLDSMQWLEDTNVLDMIVDKFSSSDCPEVHANAAEILCALTRFAPSGLSAKVSSPSFVGRLFAHALESSRPKSVLIHSLSICISLLDPRRMVMSPYGQIRGQQASGTTVNVNPVIVTCMLESVGDLLQLLDISSSDTILETTYGKLQPPLGKHRLKIVEFLAVLLTVGNEAAEMNFIESGALKRVIDLFFEYPYNNFLHHHVESIIVFCLESKKDTLVNHLLHDCDVVGKILETEKKSTLSAEPGKPTLPVEGKSPPKVGNIGHLTRISNKLVQLGESNSQIQLLLQGNSEWLEWQSNVLSKRNTVENIYQWACGRPTALQDRNRDSDDEDFRDRDYDVAALANNLSQAFHYGMYNSDEIEETHGSLEKDDEDVYFDDESAEVVISSLRLGDDQDSASLFTNSNWFAFDDGRTVNEHSNNSPPSTSPSASMANSTNANGGESIEVFADSALDVDSFEKRVDAPENGSLAEGIKALNLDGEDPNRVEWKDVTDGGDSCVSPNVDDMLVDLGEQQVESTDSSSGADTSSGDSGASSLEEDTASSSGVTGNDEKSEVKEPLAVDVEAAGEELVEPAEGEGSTKVTEAEEGKELKLKNEESI